MGQRMKFEDITEPFEYVYPDSQEIGGVNYKHIYGGVYQPENPVELMWEEFKKLAAIYCDLVFHVKKPKENFDDELREWVAVNPKEPYVVYFVNSRYMAQYDHCFENFIRSRQEFAAVRDIVDEKELDDVCWSDRNQEDETQECITGLCRFQKVDLSDRYQGYSKHIQIGNKVGYLIEPGIYYFGEPEGEERLWKKLLIIGLNRTFEKEVAVIGYATDFHPSFDIAVTYLAIGKKNFARLKEIQSTLENSFFHEFELAKEQRKMEAVDLEDLLTRKKDAEKAIEELEQPKAEPGAKELLEGMGFHNVRLGYHMAFSKRVSVREYEMAYILNGKLVLIWKENSRNGSELKRSEYDLRLFGELTVRVDVQLNCGLKLERDIKVIDCKEEKVQEMLNREELKFKELRKYLSHIDRLSLCMLETQEYKNYIFLKDVPAEYDDLYVVGIGMTESEFYKDGEFGYKADGDRENLTFATCMEIVLSGKKRRQVL